MKTLVLADLHLGTDNIEDQKEIANWVTSSVETTKPDSIVFLGDTFELILPMEHASRSQLDDHERVLTGILDAWNPLFDHLRKSDVSRLIFIGGEHDHDITSNKLESILKREFSSKDIRAATHHYDVASKSLIMHGHELDYNRIFDVAGKRVSCIDGLTRALNAYLAQTPEIERTIREATRRQEFSYWYSSGGIPNYIKTVGKLFGADKKMYEREVAKVFRSQELSDWLAAQKSPLVHTVGYITKQIAKFPSLLMPLYGIFRRGLRYVVKSRENSILAQKPYVDAPDYCFGKPVKNLILGHFHKPRETHYANGSVYNVPSPRIHVGRITEDALGIHRNLAYALLDADRITYSTRSTHRTIPLSSYHPSYIKTAKPKYFNSSYL